MTALEHYLTTTAAGLVKDDEAAERAIATTLEQRIAVGLIQARAKECEAIATELMLKNNGSRAVTEIALHLRERALKLEHIGLDLCKEYPPAEKAKLEIDHNRGALRGFTH